MAPIHHQLAIVAPMERVYEAIASPEGIGAWWEKQTAVQNGRDLLLEHRPGRNHGVVQLKVVELIPDRRVEWECISQHPAHSPASAWTGAHFLFELSEEETAASAVERESDPPGNSTRRITTLDFRQTPHDDCSQHAGWNNFFWGQVLNDLKQVCESPTLLALKFGYSENADLRQSY